MSKYIGMIIGKAQKNLTHNQIIPIYHIKNKYTKKTLDIVNFEGLKLLVNTILFIVL